MMSRMAMSESLAPTRTLTRLDRLPRARRGSGPPITIALSFGSKRPNPGTCEGSVSASRGGRIRGTANEHGQKRSRRNATDLGQDDRSWLATFGACPGGNRMLHFTLQTLPPRARSAGQFRAMATAWLIHVSISFEAAPPMAHCPRQS